MDLGFRDGRGAFQEIEITTLVSLFDMLHEQLAVSARINPLFRPPGGAPPRKLIFADAHVQLAARHIEFDNVPFLQKRQRPADEGFGRDVQDTGAVTRAAHSRIGNPYHVAYSGLQEFLRNREISPFWHSRS